VIAGTLELQMWASIARISSDMDKAKRIVGDAAATMEKMLGVIGVGFSAHLLIAKIDSVVDAMDHLENASAKTGASVENLSKLKFFADVSGSNIDAVTTALAKLSKGMAGSEHEGLATSQALKFLGLSAKDAAGNLKDPSALFGEIAQKLIAYQDGAGKAAIAQALFGKGGAEMLPTLKKQAELGDVVATLTNAQAKAASEYKLELARLNQQKEILWNTVVSALLPSMESFVKVLLDASKGTDSLGKSAQGLAEDHSIEDWADSSAMGLARLIDVTRTAFGIFSEIEAPLENLFRKMHAGFAGLSIMFGPGSFAEKNAALTALREESAVIEAELKKRYASGSLWTAKLNTQYSEALKAQMDQRKAFQKFMQGIAGDDPLFAEAAFGETKKKPLNFALGGGAGKVDEIQNLIDKQNEQADSQADGYRRTLALLGQITEESKVRYDTEFGKLALVDDALKANLITRAHELDAANAARLADENWTKAQIAREHADVNRDDRNAAQIEKFSQATREHVSQLEQEAGAYNKTKLEIEMGNEARKLENQYTAAQVGLNESELESLKKIYDLQKVQIANAVREKVSSDEVVALQKKEADKMQKIWENLAENVQRTLGQGLYDLMQGNFNNIGQAFTQMLERMLAEALAANLMRALFGGAAGGGGGIGGIIGSLIVGAFSDSGSGGGGGAGFGAKGAWFEGDAAHFGMGGVVSSPTMFSYGGGFHRGIMGEAGPEAIMPLRRDSSGRLGVEGGGKSIVINSNDVYNIEASTDRAQVRADMVKIAQQKNAELIESLSRAGAI
jgi:hypothetical protein